MRAPNHHLSFLFVISLSLYYTLALSSTSSLTIKTQYSKRRVLHEPLFPVSSAPPTDTDTELSPPPPPDSSTFPDPDQPFFPEVPASPTTNQDQNQPPPASTANETIPIPAATQPAKPAKKVAIAMSVGIVTLGMLSALAFFLYRHRVKHPIEGQKLFVGGGDNSERFPEESRAPPSSFLYIGTVEQSRTSIEPNGTGAANGSPYHKLNSVKRSDRYRPSPDLQPLPPLPKPPAPFEHENSSPPAGSSSSDEESRDTAFYTPQGSSVSNDDGYYRPVVAAKTISNGSSVRSANGKNGVHGHANANVPHSKRTSPRSWFSSVSSPEMKHVIIPSITKPSHKAPPPPPPLPQATVQQEEDEDLGPTSSYIPKRPKFAAPPPPPNMALLRSISNQGSGAQGPPAPPPPPPPPPPLAVSTAGKVGSLEMAKTSASLMPRMVLAEQKSWTPSPKTNSRTETGNSVAQVNKGASSLDRNEVDETDGGKPKLKPLHWDKVRATSDRATVWDQIKSSSFQLNEDMIESLFGCNSTNSAPKEPRKSVVPPAENENRMLDTKKSQNIAILLRALNVTRDEVSEALLDGNPESLGAELLETLVKMAPTKQEEIKLRDYHGDISKLGSAERFLKAVLDIPFAFKRVEAMLYRANFDTEVRYLRRSFQTLEEASEELKNSRLFLKLLEAVLRTGNRMNVGTNRGDAKAFKLDTLLKLVDIKGTDGKTTLLHFVVQEIIRSEGLSTDSMNENLESGTQTKMREEDFRKQGLQVVSGLSRDLGNVKKAAGMDSDVLSNYVLKLEMGLEKVRLILQYEQPDMQGKFFQSMKMFLREADDEITRVKAYERNALILVKEVTEYFHGNAAKEEAHPFRIFMIVRDFLTILDHVCKEVGKMQDRAMVGPARSFRISATASLPVLNRYKNTLDRSSDDESSSP